MFSSNIECRWCESHALSVIVDQRRNETFKNYLLSEEMEDWQGPEIWIYNNAEFSDKDFQVLIKLGIGGKSSDDENPDDSKIGKIWNRI